MKLVSAIIFFLFLSLQFAQSHNIDSLINSSNNSDNLSKIDAFIKLSDIYKNDSTQLAEQYSLKALKISEQINNDTLVVKSITRLGPILLLQNKGDKVLSMYNKALKISNNANYLEGIGITYGQIGTYYNKQNNLDSAIYFYLESANTFEKIEKFKKAAQVYNNIGIINYKKAKYDEALKYFIKSLETKGIILPNGKRVADNNELAASMVNVGLFYYKLEDNKKAITYLKNAEQTALEVNNNAYACISQINLGVIYNSEHKYDSALYYHNLALVLAEKTNSIQRKSQIYTGIANVYSNINDFDLAIEYFLKSLEIHNQINDYRGKAVVEKGITELYLKQNKLELAKKYGLETVKSAKASGNLEIEKEVYKLLSNIYELSEEYKPALDYKKNFTSLNDSINAINNNKIIAEIQTKYETEKKSAEIKELKIKDIENESIKKRFLLLISSLVIISILLIFFFRQKHKSNKILNNKNAELKKLNATQSRLMSIISHDLKSPLSAFYSITSSLKSKINIIEKSDISDYLDRMQNSSLGLKLQLENLLNWSISQSTEIRVSQNIFNLSVLTHKTAIILDEFAKEKSISINVNINDDLEINTDGRLLSIVLNNLIANAIKFSNTNDIIEISANKEANKILISIKDSGVGINESDLKVLFSGEGNSSNNENKGTGLGLIVSKDIIEKLGGKIWAESKINIGTIFYIELND